jgi:hypothetical protein
MTDRERDAPRTSPDRDSGEDSSSLGSSEDDELTGDAGPTGDEGLEDDAFVDEEFDEGEEELAAEEIDAEAEDEVDEAAPDTAGAVSRRARFGQRLGRGDGAAGAPLVTPSERAVRIDDRASQIYVIGVVATFVGILLFGALGGQHGVFTTAPPSPSPSSAVPSGSASPGESASPGVSASPSASAIPSAGSSSGASSSANPSVPPSPAGS